MHRRINASSSQNYTRAGPFQMRNRKFYNQKIQGLPRNVLLGVSQSATRNKIGGKSDICTIGGFEAKGGRRAFSEALLL